LFSNPYLGNCRLAIEKAHDKFSLYINPTLWIPEEAIELAVQQRNYEEKKLFKQRAKAKSAFFALSTSSEEDILEAPPKLAERPLFKTTTTSLSNISTTLQTDLEISALNQNSKGLTLNPIGQAATMPISSAPTLALTKELTDLIQDSLSVEKKYFFLLKRANEHTLLLTFISSKESPRAEGRRLDALQKAIETCLQTASLEYECSLSGQNEETLIVVGDKKVINFLCNLLVGQGLDMNLTEIDKRKAFFKGEKSEINRPNSEEDESTFACAMQ
jgi:hypothetical protein